MENATEMKMKTNRPYIERLRRDPRTKALFDSFVYQAMVEVREQHGRPESPYEAEKFAHVTAEKAVALAMSFVLDNDGEYKMLREQFDQLMQTMIDARHLSPGPSIIITATGEKVTMTPEELAARDALAGGVGITVGGKHVPIDEFFTDEKP